MRTVNDVVAHLSRQGVTLVHVSENGEGYCCDPIQISSTSVEEIWYFVEGEMIAFRFEHGLLSFVSDHTGFQHDPDPFDDFILVDEEPIEIDAD